MCENPGNGPPQEEISEPKTLGQVLFPGTLGEMYTNADKLFEPIWKVDSDHEIEKEILALKLLPESDGPSLLVVFGKIFDCLSKPFDMYITDHVSGTIISNGLKKSYRQRIGKISLEIFFDIFEKDTEHLWSCMAGSQGSSAWFTESPKTLEDEDIAISDLTLSPVRLHQYLCFFASCNEATKSDYKSKIRKFLKLVLDKPLSPHWRGEKLNIGLSKWTKSARIQLTHALIANGMYEECIEYTLPEAYRFLVAKFLGPGFVEREDGLIYPVPFGNNLSPEEAMTKALENKEWAHIWSVITRMAYRTGQAELIRTTDPNDPGIEQGHTNVSLKLAFFFKNGLTNGLDGF